jgi:hypothetical protein
MVPEILTPPVHDPIRNIPTISVSDRIATTLDIHPVTLRALSIHGRGYIPRTSSISLSAWHKPGIYQDFLISNLPPEMYEMVLERFAKVF